MTRREQAAKVAALRDAGMLQREIAAELGISRSHVSSLLLDPDGSKDRERKARYGGTCEKCGGRTDGSSGRERAPRFCYRCVCVNSSDESRARRTVWTRGAIISAIREWADEHHGQPPAFPDWDPWMARHKLGDEERAQAYELDPRWPSCSTVVYQFGSWNAGIAAAGFTPRARHGGDGNQWRRRVA